ncbi:hypothetical protein ACWERW_25085 [Streptomyces sp. NPDC004012]
MALVDHDRQAARRARHFLVVIGVFLTGALAVAWLTAPLGTRAIWIAAALVVVCLFRYLLDDGRGGPVQPLEALPAVRPASAAPGTVNCGARGRVPHGRVIRSTSRAWSSCSSVSSPRSR